MSDTKLFHIGDILSITDGHLVSPRHIDGVYDILNWLTDDNLFTHQLPRAVDECSPFLREQFPDLAAVEAPDFGRLGLGPQDVLEWLDGVVAELGEYRDVPRAPAADHARIDPLLELSNMVGANKVITAHADGRHDD